MNHFWAPISFCLIRTSRWRGRHHLSTNGWEIDQRGLIQRGTCTGLRKAVCVPVSERAFFFFLVQGFRSQRTINTIQYNTIYKKVTRHTEGYPVIEISTPGLT